jgi:hypothetical protein
MTGSSVEEDRMAAERLLAEQLMDLPDTALSGAGLVVQSCKAKVLKTSKSRPILRYIVTCLDREKAAPVRRVIIGKGCYRHDGNKVFGFMRRLWSEGFAGDRRLTIPEPIAYLPELILINSSTKVRAMKDENRAEMKVSPVSRVLSGDFIDVHTELYDVTSDPAETRNIVDGPRAPRNGRPSHRADQQRGSLPMTGPYEIPPLLTKPAQGASK